MAWLKITAGQQAGAKIRLDQSRCTAGRDPSNDIELVDTKASRRHMEFVWAEDHYELVDLGSKNGTQVNGIPVERHYLEDGDWIQVGGYVITYVDDSDLVVRDVQVITGWLKIIEGQREGATFLLGERICTAGRDPGNVIQLVDDDTSRRHVQFRWTGTHYELQDLESTNGTYVNGQRCDAASLEDGDQVQIGAYLLRFELLSAARYRDEGLRAKDVRERHRVENTNVINLRDVHENRGRPIRAREVHHGAALSEESSVDFDVDVDIDVEESLAIDIEVEYGQDLGDALGRVLTEVRSDSPLPAFWAAMLDELVAALHPDRALLLAFKGPSLVARGIYADGESGHRSLPPNLDQSAVRQVLDQRKGLCLRDMLAGRQETRETLAELPSTVLCAPLRSFHTDCGVVYVDRLGPAASAFDKAELNFTRDLAGHIAEGVALRRAR